MFGMTTSKSKVHLNNFLVVLGSQRIESNLCQMIVALDGPLVMVDALLVLVVGDYGSYCLTVVFFVVVK